MGHTASACQKSIFAKLLTNFRTSKSSEIRRLIERAGDFLSSAHTPLLLYLSSLYGVFRQSQTV